LVSHADINVNLKTGRNYPLKKARQRRKRNSEYQVFVDRLVALGAVDQ